MEEISSLISSKPFCEIHKKSQYQFARLSCTDNENPFLCSMCLIQREQKDPVISIEEVLFIEDAKPISNWPPGIDQETLQFLKWKNSAILKDRMRKGIMKFYEQLRSDINEILHSSEKEQLLELEKFILGSDEVLHFYNTKFKRKELVDAFANSKSFDKEKYMNILNSISEEKENDLLKLAEEIEEKRAQEIIFRDYQKTRINDIIDNIILKINELSDDIFNNHKKEENDECLLEDYIKDVYWTLSENKEFQRNSKRNEIELQKKINQYEKKSTFMFEKQEIYDLSYEQGEIIKISNPKKQKGMLESYYFYNFANGLSLTIKFNTLTSLQNFQLIILTSGKRKIPLTKLLNEVQLYFKHSRNTPLQFKIIIKDNSIEIQKEGFNEKEDISSYKNNELKYYFQFWLDTDCEGFELTKGSI